MMREPVVFVVCLCAAVFCGVSARADTIFASQRGSFETDLSGEYCYPQSGVKVVDTSAPIDAGFLTRMASFGVEVVARYYNYSEDALPPGVSLETWRAVPQWRLDLQNRKLITAREVALLKAHGMSSIAVFQYQSDQEATFANWRIRGPADAKRALDLAKQLGQPIGSTIYFGADGDFVHHYDRPCGDDVAAKPNRCVDEVAMYFTEVSEPVQAAGYDVGVYGSGATCKLLTEAGLVSHCWLNSSVGHTGRAFGETSKFTVLRQLLDLQKYRTPKPAKPVRARFETEVAFLEAFDTYTQDLAAHETGLKLRDAALERCGRDLDFNVVRSPEFGQFVYK